jgi:hypothetical protein
MCIYKNEEEAVNYPNQTEEEIREENDDII